MARGWFVGDFQPTALNTQACEVAVKHFKKNDHEDKHYHKIATEITVIVSGEVRMGENKYATGDIITIEPFVATDFEALTDAVVVAVKVPGAKDDKYLS